MMNGIMYDIPSDDSIKKFTITKEMVEKETEKEETKNAELIQMPTKNKAEIA